MDKQMRNFFNFAMYLTAISSISMIAVFAFVGFSFSSAVSYVFLGASVGGFSYSVWYVVRYNRLLKQYLQEREQKKLLLDLKNKPMVDIYLLFGIKPQYDENGNIKDIFKLLEMEPEYDAKGNRLPTIYELLDIFPSFDKNGKEIPSVIVIKHYVKSFKIKDLKKVTMKRKLSEEEKARYALKQLLLKKLEEANDNKNTSKATAIKKVLKSVEAKKGEEKGKDGGKGGKKKEDKPLFRKVVFKSTINSESVSVIEIFKSMLSKKPDTSYSGDGFKVSLSGSDSKKRTLDHVITGNIRVAEESNSTLDDSEMEIEGMERSSG